MQHFTCEALLLSHQINANTHAGVNRMINLHFVKSGILSAEDKILLNSLFRMRHTGDYDDLADWTEDEVRCVIEPTTNFIQKIKSLIQEN